MVFRKAALALNNLISSPRKDRILLTRSHHLLPLDLERDQVADEIRRFFLGCSLFFSSLSSSSSSSLRKRIAHQRWLDYGRLDTC